MAWLVSRRRTAEYWRQVAALLFSTLAGARLISTVGTGMWWWKTPAIGVIALVAVLALRHTVSEERKRSPVVAGLPSELRSANARWLSEHGRVVVVTRDMSWVIDEEVRAALSRKAASGELLVFATASTPELAELATAGADVRILHGIPPTTRFTVLRWGTTDARVLVHRQVRGVVEFYERTPSDFAEYWLALDVVDLLSRLNPPNEGSPRD